MPVQAEDILNTARMFLNDLGSSNPQLWTDTVLMPMLQRAHQELQVILKKRAAPIMKTHTLQVINVGVQQIAPISDMQSPIMLVEAATGQPGTLMTESDPLPLMAQQTSLNFWQWDGATIKFTGATSNRDVEIYYWRTLPLPQTGTDTIQIIGGEMWLAPRTAAIAAASLGEAEAATMAGQQAERFLEEVVIANRGRATPDMGASVRP
jgi:hypothetical protein